VSRLHIREAGFDGCSEAHEDVVCELAAALDGWLGKGVVAPRTKREPKPYRAPQENLTVRRGLREHAIDRQEWANMAQPCELLPAAAEAVQTAMRLSSRRGALQALPVFAEDARTTRASRAGSVVAEALAKFISSDEGREWQHERKSLFGADAPH